MAVATKLRRCGAESNREARETRESSVIYLGEVRKFWCRSENTRWRTIRERRGTLLWKLLNLFLGFAILFDKNNAHGDRRGS
jgi:hypothetical protein